MRISRIGLSCVLGCLLLPVTGNAGKKQKVSRLALEVAHLSDLLEDGFSEGGMRAIGTETTASLFEVGLEDLELGLELLKNATGREQGLALTKSGQLELVKVSGEPGYFIVDKQTKGVMQAVKNLLRDQIHGDGVTLSYRTVPHMGHGIETAREVTRKLRFAGGAMKLGDELSLAVLEKQFPELKTPGGREQILNRASAYVQYGRQQIERRKPNLIRRQRLQGRAETTGK